MAYLENAYFLPVHRWFPLLHEIGKIHNHRLLFFLHPNNHFRITPKKHLRHLHALPLVSSKIHTID